MNATLGDPDAECDHVVAPFTNLPMIFPAVQDDGWGPERVGNSHLKLAVRPCRRRRGARDVAVQVVGVVVVAPQYEVKGPSSSGMVAGPMVLRDNVPQSTP
jgi:hypothetical protein